MKKRIISLLMAVVLAATLLPVQAWGATVVDSGYCGGEGDGTNLTWTLDSDGVLTIIGEGKMRDYRLYTGPLAPWTDNHSRIKNIVIGTGVSSIGGYAFCYCPNLTSVTIPDSVASIGSDAFYQCNSLTSITIPDGVTSIEDDTFNHCYDLTSITIPNSVTSIGRRAFQYCESLTSITIPNSVTSIGNYAFEYCKSLTRVNITDLEVWCKINFEDEDANPLYYGHNLYLNGELLENLVFPSSLTSINSYTFAGCRSLTSAVIPNSVTSVGGNAFRNCTGLTSINIPSSVTSIGGYAFYGCGRLTSITIPSSITSIRYGTFQFCSSLTSVTIPSSVTSIEGCAFEYCKSLTRVNITDLEAWCNISFGDKGANPLYCGHNLYLNGELLTNLVFPSSLTSINPAVFAGCNLTSVTIPSGVTSIGGSAFNSCTSLTSIYIPSSVTSIGDDAFGDCKSLTSVTIPRSVTSIGSYAFDDCNSLTSINIPDSVTYIEKGTFNYCTSLASITIPSSVKSIRESAFYRCESLTSITIPSSATYIGDNAFSRCTSLASITIPSSVKSIGESAFYDCTSLTDVYYTGSETEWSRIRVYSDNTRLTRATIHYNSSGPEDPTIYNAATSELALTVYENKKGSNVRNTDYQLSKDALVSYGSINETTDKNGQISQPYSGGAVTVSKDGYVSRTVSEAALKVNPTVWLQKESDTYPVISAVWMDDVNDIMNAEYFLPLVQSTSHTVRAEVSWGNSSMQSLKLAQGTTTVDISDNSNTTIRWSDKFDLSEDILVVATNADGKTASKTLKISSGSKELSTLDEFTFGCGDDLGFTLPEDIPIVGGLKMKLGVYSPVPVSYSIENGKIYLAIGYQVDADDDPNSTSGIKEYVDAAKVLGKTISDAKGSIDSYKKIRSAMKAFKGKTAVLKGSWGMDCGFSIVGFYEGYYDKDYNLCWIDGGVVIDINGGISYNQPFVIGPVPCYAEAALSAEAQAKLNLLIAEAVKEITPDGVISGEISLDLGVGAGMKAIATLGGGVTGTASSTVAYASQAISSAQIKLGLEGYFKVTALFFEKKWPITLAEKIVYEYPDYSSHSAYTMEGDETEDFYDTVYDTGSYSQPDLSYLASGSPFLANGSGVMLQAARAVTVDSVNAFQSNTYQNAAPQLLCLSDGTMMAVWTGYDSSRSGMNALCLYYSRYDSSSWSEPAILDNDGTMDCGFTLREINGAPCVVWENASSTIETSDDLDAVAAKMSISAARYVDGAFVVERVSDAAGVDMMPDVCAVGDGLSVVWVRNESGDLFANDGTNKIVCRTMTGEGWSEESVLYSGLNSVDSLAVGTSGDTLQVAYSMDTDGDLTTSADMEVYINGSAATSDSVIDSGVQYENGQFYWYKDGALMSGGSEMVPAASNLRSDRYQVVEGSGVKAVLFTQANGVYSSLYGIFCDTATGTWGEPVALTDGSDSIQSFSASPTANGIQVMVNRLAVTGDGSTGDPYGEARIDILDLTLGCDLAVEDVYCDMQYYMADNRLPMTVTVANKGRQAVNQVKFTFLVEDGTELGTETLDVSLPAGVTQEIETGFTVGEVVQGRKISVQVTPVDNTDLDTSDNAAELTLQQQDIALENMFWGLNSDGQAVIYADVVNRGYTASGTLTVSLRKGSETGEAIGSVTVDSLDTLGLQRVSFETAYEEGAVYYLTLDECADDSIANNSDFVVLRQEQHDLAEGEIALSAENFPDDSFRAYLRETFDTDGDGIINSADVIEIDCSGRGIQSLKGIELFTELEKLSCSDNQLTELDTTKNTKLTEVDCSGNSALKQVTLPSQDVLVDTTGNGGTEVGVNGMTETGVTVSGKLNTETLGSGDRVCLTLKQGDATCRSLRTGDDTFSFAGVAPGTYTLLASQEGYVPREYTVEIGEDGTISDLTVQIVRRGDVNGAVSSMGYAVDASDMQCLYEMLTSETYSGNIEDETYRKAVADINSDGAVDVYDLQRLYETVSGIAKT